MLAQNNLREIRGGGGGGGGGGWSVGGEAGLCLVFMAFFGLGFGSSPVVAVLKI